MRLYRFAFCFVAAVSQIAFLPVHSQVFDEARGGMIPTAHTCVARNWHTGQFNQVRQRSGPSNFWAHADWDADGTPAITYGPAYYNLSRLMKSFTSVHECGHLVLATRNEFAANCFALKHLDLDEDELEEIGKIHNQLGRLGPQYGGSGAAFWAGTEHRCPEYFP